MTVFFAMTLTSCNQKELDQFADVTHWHVNIEVSYDFCWHVVCEGGPDWKSLWDDNEYMMTYESLLPSEPSGLRAVVYNQNSPYDIFNLPAHGGEIGISEGWHSLMLFNNDTEYIVFNDISKGAEASATTRTRTRSSYYGSPYVMSEANQTTINPPDMLFACDGGTFSLSEEDLEMEYEMRPLVYRYLVRYHFIRGIHHVVLSRGALAGMAASVYLSDGHTSTQPATLLYDIDLKNKRVTDAESGEGMLYAVVNSFGLPGFPNDYYSRDNDIPCGLNIELKLTNGNTLSFDYDISEQISKQPRGGVIDVYGIEIKDEDASPGEGSFEVDVEGWGNHQDLVLF